MQRIEEVQAAECRAHRQRVFLREARDAVRGFLRPAAAAEDNDRRACRGEKLCELRHLGCTRRGLDRRKGRRIIDRYPLGEHVFGQAHDHRTRPSVSGGVERARYDFRHPRRIVDLGRPFGHRAKHGAVVEFLKRFAVGHVACDLAYEHHQRGRILAGDVDAGRGVGGARPAGDETDARAAGRLAHRLRHHRGAALLPAHGNGNVAVVERVDRSEIAFARHAEHVLDAVNAQLIDQNLCGRTIIVLTAHRRLRDVGAADSLRRASLNFDCRDRRR